MAKAPLLSNTGAVQADRLRALAIIQSPEGQRNPTAAVKLALVDGLREDTARDVLRGLPAANPYIEYLEREGAVGISGPTAPAGTPGVDDARTRRMAEIKEAAMRVNIERGYVAAPEGYDRRGR